MENYTTQNRNVQQISVFVLPGEKKLIQKKADEENRSVSNYCKLKILGANDATTNQDPN